MPTHYARIIAAVDGSEHAGRAAAAAAGLAKDMNKPLTLLYVLPGPSGTEFVSIDTVQGALHPQPSTPAEIEKASREASTKVFAAARAAIADSGVQVEEKVVAGPVVPEILRVAEELKPALVVVGRRGLGGFGEFLLGSVSNKLVHQGAVPVLVV
jgi:nucleotide-binding universal stress UspA family protein